MDKVTSYEERIKADGGTSNPANTVQGRRDRAMRRSAGAAKVQSDLDDEGNNDNEAEKTDDEHIDEDGSYEEGEDDPRANIKDENDDDEEDHDHDRKHDE